MRSADKLFTELRVKKVDLVKIDAEGAEQLILESCSAQLDRLQPRAIVFEDNNKIANSEHGIGLMLDQIGYDLYGIKKSLLRLTLIKVDFNGPNHFHDYIAVSRRRNIAPKAANIYDL
jgi:hypothetical protein